MANIHTPIPALKLSDGNSIPMLGYGLGTAWNKKDTVVSKLDQACVDAISTTLKLGYKHLDVAEEYQTERELGKAISDSGIDRAKLFVTTKVSDNVADVEGALKSSLSKLGLEYVDLYLIHNPWVVGSGSAADLQTAWKGMEAVRAAGLTKSIGVSNFLPEHLEAILEVATAPPVVNQIELHAYLQRPDLVSFHKMHGIATVAYGPLTPMTRVQDGGPIDDFLAALAKKYAVNPAEVLIRWCVDQDVVAITTSGKEQRLSDYLRAMTFKLTPKEIEELNSLGSQKHFRAFFKKRFAEDDRK